jgi:hypothetical protein
MFRILGEERFYGRKQQGLPETSGARTENSPATPEEIGDVLCLVYIYESTFADFLE